MIFRLANFMKFATFMGEKQAEENRPPSFNPELSQRRSQPESPQHPQQYMQPSAPYPAPPRHPPVYSGHGASKCRRSASIIVMPHPWRVYGCTWGYNTEGLTKLFFNLLVYITMGPGMIMILTISLSVS